MINLLDRLSADLSQPRRDLLYLIKSAPYRYKVYQIAKRAPGKKRTIAQPARELKPLQYWVMENLLSNFPIHDAARAYRKGRNIFDNAAPHANHRYLCKVDFKNFFPSIKSEDLERFIHSQANATEWTDDDLDYLCKILFWCKERGKPLQLSIGAPSSPLVSNILLYRFDVEISKLCAELGVTYTRYADDLSFSTNRSRVLSKIVARIPKICSALQSPRLILNRSKTVHASKRSSRRVTGLVLTNDGQVSIGREKKRTVRSAFHHYVSGLLNEKEIAQLAGMVAFVNSVEPGFLVRLSIKYGADKVTHLLSNRRVSDSEPE